MIIKKSFFKNALVRIITSIIKQWSTYRNTDMQGWMILEKLLFQEITS